jgi:ATP-dependent Clp protease ATP-binding subunit ClpC
LFERFTDRARRLVILAQEEARMFNHDYIGTEHILLALSREEGVAARALETLNISLEAARQQVEEIIGRGPEPLPGHIPFTPRATTGLERAFREAMQLGHDYIGTEHILLGLIREGEGVGAEVLQRLGADLVRVRQSVIQLLSGYTTLGHGETSSPSRFQEREKIVVSLLIHEGMTTSEIANVLDISEEGVLEIVMAVIKKLKRI